MNKIHVLAMLPNYFAQTQQPSGPGSAFSLLAPVLMIAAMYFLLIAPQRKKQKEHDKMLAGLKAGDEVVTTGGIYGVITGVKPDRFVIRIGDNNAKVEVGKSFIHGLVKKTES